ncbi:MAG: hypothetical protein Q9219_004774 [cf. Caloplaca sp. 3 TL-2023]
MQRLPALVRERINKETEQDGEGFQVVKPKKASRKRRLSARSPERDHNRPLALRDITNSVNKPKSNTVPRKKSRTTFEIYKDTPSRPQNEKEQEKERSTEDTQREAGSQSMVTRAKARTGNTTSSSTITKDNQSHEEPNEIQQ